MLILKAIVAIPILIVIGLFAAVGSLSALDGPRHI
jgi:hypothetical protein